MLLALLPAWPALAQGGPSDYLRRFDRDADGRISRVEYVQYMSAGFRRLDGNADDVLDTAELPPGPRRGVRTLAAFQADLKAQFKRLDRNRDRFLSVRELAQPPR